MRTIDLGHIAWAKTTEHRHRYSLSSSTLCAPDLASLGLPAQGALPAGEWGKLQALERALGERYATPTGRVLITAGGSEANACVFAGVLEPGDEVLVERPGYQPHRAVPPLFGATIRTFDRTHAQSYGGFADALAAAIGPRTRLIVVSHLHNPSGVALTAADLDALDRLAEAHDLRILCDEAFGDAADGPLGCFASRGAAWITTASLTKAYGLEGLRIGWVAAHADVLERCAAAQNALSADVSMPSVTLALALMPHLEQLRARGQGIVADNRARWNAWVERAAVRSGLQASRSSHGVTTWCTLGRAGAGDALSDFAADRFDLAVAPGRFFADPNGFRVSLGGDPPRFAEALERLEAALHHFLETEAGSGARE